MIAKSKERGNISTLNCSVYFLSARWLINDCAMNKKKKEERSETDRGAARERVAGRGGTERGGEEGCCVPRHAPPGHVLLWCC